MFAQSMAITGMNLRNVFRRPGTSLVIVVGIAGVVTVLVGLLAMAAGFQSALTSSSSPDRAIILGHGSQNEMNSWLSVEEENILSGFEGFTATSGELYTAIDLRRRDDGETAYVVARGVTSDAFRVRPEVRIVAGRPLEAGRGEILAGRLAAREYEGLGVGEKVELRGRTWTVAGHFDAGGTAVDSEVWMDLSLAQAVFRRNGVNTMRVNVDRASDMERLRHAIEADPRLDAELISEGDFYSAQSEARAKLIRTFTYFVASIMSVGAIVAAINSMYVAVSSRRVEIATLRAIGFSRSPILVSILAEAVLLALAGGIAGTVLVYLAVDGYTTSTLNGASNTQVSFTLAVTPPLVATGVACALFLGFLGGLLPAIQAVFAPITGALLGR